MNLTWQEIPFNKDQRKHKGQCYFDNTYEIEKPNTLLIFSTNKIEYRVSFDFEIALKLGLLCIGHINHTSLKTTSD